MTTREVALHVGLAGSGPPLLLLHGYPQTQATWHRIAPVLAQRFSLPAVDDVAAFSKRAMARDCVALMAALGHERFAVVGHDRGARVAYRLALDHPARVTKLVVLDVIPRSRSGDSSIAPKRLQRGTGRSWRSRRPSPNG